ncbi:unnamed protein product, partial [Effrenium voratum]
RCSETEMGKQSRPSCPKGWPTFCHVKQCAGQMCQPVWSEHHEVWIASCDGYQQSTASGKNRASHHQAVHLFGSWTTTSCLSKTLREYGQSKGQASKQKSRVEQAAPADENQDRTLADLAGQGNKTADEKTLVEDPTLLALTAAPPPSSSKRPAGNSDEGWCPSEPGSSSKATASAAQSSQVQGEEAASASSTRKPSSTPEKDKQKDSDTVATGNPLQTPAKDSRKATKRKPQAESDTPEDKKKKKKKVPPPGCGGAHPKAQGCKICARPRDAFQRGTACATCQTLMRKKKCRSIPTVLADPAKRDEIRAESLALKPVALDDVQEQRERVAKIEKHLAELKQLLGKGS